MSYFYIIKITRISIHALLAESDRPNSKKYINSRTFLSTLSLRRATSGTAETAKTSIGFLSTLSLRRATDTNLRRHRSNNDFYPRSPCGERPRPMPAVTRVANFYPRSPCGERPGQNLVNGVSLIISIHALLAESDGQNLVNGVSLIISIHALLAESDLLMQSMVVILIIFLSTLSLRRATSSFRFLWC